MPKPIVDNALKDDLLEGKKNLEAQEMLRAQKFHEIKARNDQLKQESYEKAEAKANRIVKLPSGEQGTYRQLSNNYAKKLTSAEGANAYVEFSTAMMDLLHGYTLMVRAHPDGALARGVDFVWTSARELGHAALSSLGLKDPVRKSSVKELSEDEIVYSVSFDDTGVLTSEVTKNGAPLPPELQVKFDAGFLAWAYKTGGYKLDETTGIIANDDGPMTQEILMDLNQNDMSGLGAFYKGSFELDVKCAPTPSM